MEYLGEFQDRGKQIITQCQCGTLMYMKENDFLYKRRTNCGCVKKPRKKRVLSLKGRKYMTKSRRLLAYNGDY